MLPETPSTQKIPGYCALCVSRCGAIAVVEDDRFVALEPNPSHPTGQSLCAKGRAAPELVNHPDRLLYPLKRTHPKTDPDPGWQRISWDEALDLTAAQLRRIATQYGPESVVFSTSSPSTSAIDDSLAWVQRLTNAFGSPNMCGAVELCGWGRYYATQYTFGASVPGAYMPDLEQAGVILYWGYNPNLARLSHATATQAALKRGAHLIIVDPRQIGLAKKADLWLQVRPGTDGALALSLAQVMLSHNWYDQAFIREWTNGPLLVRQDTGKYLTQADVSLQGSPEKYFVWSETLDQPLLYDPVTGAYPGDNPSPALFGTYPMETLQGPVICRPIFQLAADLLQQYPPERVAVICGVPADQIVSAARLLWEARPVAYYAWSGVEMQTNSTQIARAIAQLSILTGSFDAPGGNVAFTSPPSSNVFGWELIPQEKRTKALGFPERPLGPARWQFVTTEEIYQAVLEQKPYGVHALVTFGSNLLLSHAAGLRGREALAALDFYVHTDLFMNPTAELADIVLPVASAFEREALRIGFEGSQAAQSRIQLRPPVVPPRGEARSDTQIVFDLACRLGLGEFFWEGDIEAAYRYQLAPSGVSIEELRAHPAGIDLPLETRYRKFAEQVEGKPRGFRTPTRKIELYSQVLFDNGYPALPDYVPPLVSPVLRPDLAERYPLILTCVKNTLFCESQHRALPSLRKKSLDPEVELHPSAAAQRGIQAGDWVSIDTPQGSVRARARLVDSLDPQVVCGQHGWWQACPELGAPGYDPFSSDGANFNLIIGNDAIDPVSGSVPHRAYMCQVRHVD